MLAQARSTIYLSRAGMAGLATKIEELIAHTQEVKRLLGEAAADNADLPENTEFKQHKATLQFDIPQAMTRLVTLRDQAVIIEDSPEYQGATGEVVFVGAAVTLEYHNGSHDRWVILGHDESDPDNLVLANNTPLAQAMLGKTIGEEFAFRGSTYRILSIEKALG